jgi:hypothetical protein
MNFSFRSLSLTALGLSALTFAAGCEVSKCKTDEGQDATCAESLETTYGTEVTMEQPYDADMDLTIESVKGEVILVLGDPGVVSVDLKPFTVRGHSKDVDAQEDLEQGWSGDVRTEGNAVVVETLQTGESDEVGANLYVRVPPEFNGAIRIVNHSVGEVDVGKISIQEGAAASAWSVSMESFGLGDCNLDGSVTIIDTFVDCEGEVEITNVSDNVTALGRGTILDNAPFGVRVSFAGISADAEGGEIASEHGNVELNMPADGNFQITAAPNADGALQFGGSTLPPDCESSDNVVSCGTGAAVYLVSASTESNLDPGNVNVDFH